MGHVAGKGLGKNLQGISTPVEAVKRKGKGAISYYGTERSDRSLKDYPVKRDSEEEEEEQYKQQLQQWKKGGVGGYVCVLLLHTTVKPVLRDHCHERPPVLTDHTFSAEGPTFQ